MLDLGPSTYVLIFLAIYIFAKIKILPDQQRFAVIVLGRFQKFKGPGVLVKWPGGEVLWVKISVGDRGEVLTPGWLRIRDRDFPFKPDNSIKVGNFVRIIGFTEDKLIVAYDNNQQRLMVCENCGHENSLT